MWLKIGIALSEGYINKKIWSVTELIAGEFYDFAGIYRNINQRTYLIARAA